MTKTFQLTKGLEALMLSGTSNKLRQRPYSTLNRIRVYLKNINMNRFNAFMRNLEGGDTFDIYKTSQIKSALSRGMIPNLDTGNPGLKYHRRTTIYTWFSDMVNDVLHSSDLQGLKTELQM